MECRRNRRRLLFCLSPNSAVNETMRSITDRDVFRAIADPTRRRILALLRERDMTAGELASRFDLSWPTMSGHFSVLREAGLVQTDRSGSTITYHLNVTVLQETLMALMDSVVIDPRERAR
jgi:ArsR family transcriptional regulator